VLEREDAFGVPLVGFAGEPGGEAAGGEFGGTDVEEEGDGEGSPLFRAEEAQ